jgi:hypothetical protein
MKHLGVFVAAAKGGTGGVPPRDALVTRFGRCILVFEQGTRQDLIVGLKHIELFDQTADFNATLLEQFGLFAFEAGLFFHDRLEAGPVIRWFFHRFILAVRAKM